MRYRLVIDRLKCEGNGRCMQRAAALIQPAVDGSPVVAETLFGVEYEAMARSAAAACPMAAIGIETVEEQ
jgi:ferredoxin